MKAIPLFFCATLFLAPVMTAPVEAQTIRLNLKRDKKEVALDWLLDTENLWAMSPDEFEKTAGKRNFVWQDKERTRARFNPDSFQYTLKETKVGEVLVNFTGGKLNSATISVLNKGDEDEIIDRSAFTNGTEAVKSILSGSSGAKEEVRKKEEMITKAEGAVWRCKKALYIGEWLFLPEKKEEIDGWIWTTKAHGEFVRIRIMPPQAQLGVQLAKKKVTVTRPLLAARVKREGKTKAVLDTVPMVDQGSKGYCAVASFERVLRYYGADVDMHDLANLAETYGGTNPQKMKNAVFKVSQKLGMRTRESFFLKPKQYESLFKDYNRFAKKEQKTEVDLKSMDWDDVDPSVLKLSRTSSADFLKFKQEVVQNINKGVPIMWALRLGLFWEDKIEESWEANRYATTKDSDEDGEDEKEAKEEAEERAKEMEELRKKNPRPPSYMGGGHMRLIVGYDVAKQVIFYTDSWGPGHEMKSMPIDEAWTTTLAMFVIEPQ